MKSVYGMAPRLRSTGILGSVAWLLSQALVSPLCVAQDYDGPRIADERAEMIPPLSGPYSEPIQTSDGAATELIPPPPQASAPAASALPEGCLPAPQDPPLWSLTVEVAPLDPNGQIVADARLPENCAKYVYTKEWFRQFGLTCVDCEMNICDLLQLANYDRRPLYFEEKALEKCGIRSCYCQPAKSACQFYGTALLLPCKMMAQCPCTTYVPDGPCY